MKTKRIIAVLSAAAISFSCITSVNAESESFTYKVTSDTATAVSPIETGYDGITLTIGADTYTYTADKTLSGFDGRISGKANPNVSAGTGSYYSITLADTVKDGELTIGYQVGNDKAFYITDNGTALDAYNGVKYTSKTTDIATIMAKGGHTYTMYASGSKASFYGFTYNIVDKQSDFENEIQGLTFDLIKGDNKSEDAIDSNLELPQSYESKFGSCDVAWTSSNSDVIANSGEVSLSTKAETITLTGKFSVQEDDSLVQYKEYTLTTIADNDDSAAVAAAKEALSIGDVSNLKKDITLPTSGKRATAITWETSDESVITADGVITRSPKTDKSAVLTAIITRGEISATKTFDVTVAGYVAIDFTGYVYGDADGNTVFSPVDGGTIKNINFTEDIANSKGDDVIVGAVYDSTGILKNTRLVKISEITKETDGRMTAEVNLPMDKADTFKAFALADMANINPYTSAYSPDDTVTSGATIYVIGDSTAAVYDDKNYPRKGWAQELQNYFDEKDVKVVDLALSGRSSKSFKGDTNFQTYKDNIKKGDYLIVQFGHNDSKNTTEDDIQNRYTDPSANRFTNGSFKNSMLEYIEIAESVGAKPILATSISRRRTSDASLEAYVNAAKELGEELGIPCIDLYKRTTDWIKEVGVEEAKSMFNHVLPYDSRFIDYEGFKSSNFYTKEATDDTHINIYGADLISYFAIQEMQSIHLPLAEKYNNYTPTYPLPSFSEASSVQ